MNWRKRKKLWKKQHMWHSRRSNWTKINGSNKSLDAMWRHLGIGPAKDWVGVERRTLRYWA